MSADDGRLQSFTIYLAKQGLEGPSDTIKGPENLLQFPIVDGDGELGTLYVERKGSKPPRWSSFFIPQVDPLQLGWVSSTAAVLHSVINGRAFLLVFGQGRHLLRSVCWEDRFGLRVTLNSIGENQVRSIDKNTLDTVGRHTRVQVSKESAPSEFGLDIERDLLRAITGTPIDTTLGNTLSGLDSLHANVHVHLRSLRVLLSRYLDQFEKDTFKETFPWVDQISEIKDPTLTTQLDIEMLRTIAENRFDRCWLAVPEPIEWAQTAGFRYGRGRKFATHHDIHFRSFLVDNEITSEHVTAEFLLARDVFSVDGEGSRRHTWSAYKCIYCEVDYDQGTYLLSSGRWYKVASDFVGQVNDFYNKVSLLNIDLPEYNDESETAYNTRVSDGDLAQYALMDRKIIPVGGGYSKVEFCDIFSNNNEIIHIKRYGSSGVLSHLFNQGVVSGQLFVSDADFRKAVNDRLPDSHQLADSETRPEPSAFRVVFAIVSSETGNNLTLPFFSRLSFRNAFRTLEGYGYKVALAKIPVNEPLAKTKKIQPTQTKRRLRRN
jgi:uncharacterized protein (TIGR04141 family)